jgi:hypothetical protein
MKVKFFIAVVSMLTLASCDAPRDRRALFSTNSNAVTSTSTNTPTPTATTTSTPTPSSTTTVYPTDVNSACKFTDEATGAFLSSSTHAGSYTMCKSTSNDNVAYFQIKTPPTDTSGNSVQLCFIPMTTSGSNSIYIGNPMCGYFTNSTVKKITFTKYSAYSNATLSSVMFFKDTNYYYSAFNAYTNTLTAFQACMNALYYGNTTYCNSFKSTGQYVMQNF